MKPKSILQEESDDEVLARDRLQREREVMVDFTYPLRPAAETVQDRSSQALTSSTNIDGMFGIAGSAAFGKFVGDRDVGGCDAGARDSGAHSFSQSVEIHCRKLHSGWTS
jgi:hypothetical protein